MMRYVLLLGLVSSLAQADMNITRELVAPDQVVPGQPVRVAVTYWTDSWFNPPPAWPEMSITNGALLTTSLPNQLLTRNDHGISWSGIRMEKLVMTWDQGVLRLPAMEVTLQSGGQPPKTVQLAALEKQVAWPEGVQQPDRFLPAGSLTLAQKWVIHRAVDDKSLHVGDVIERQVTLRATDVIAAQIPPLLFAIAGSGSQRLTPQSRPLTQGRGDIVGVIREERLRYLPDQAGKLTLPPIKLRWWDTTHHQWQLAELPGTTFTVASQRDAGAEQALRASDPSSYWKIIIGVTALVVLALLGFVLRRRLLRTLRYLHNMTVYFCRVLPLPELAPGNRKKR